MDFIHSSREQPKATTERWVVIYVGSIGVRKPLNYVERGRQTYVTDLHVWFATI